MEAALDQSPEPYLIQPEKLECEHSTRRIQVLWKQVEIKFENNQIIQTSYKSEWIEKLELKNLPQIHKHEKN